MREIYHGGWLGKTGDFLWVLPSAEDFGKDNWPNFLRRRRLYP
jgi:hypothetical protein